MTTKVGMQSDFTKALQDLAELDFDAIEAYEAAINRLENQAYKIKLEEFKQDHIRHTTEIAAILKTHNADCPTGPDGKQWVAKGKVMLATLMGDRAILMAMISNEIDTNTAYERLNYHEDKWPESVNVLRKGLEDERKHKEWLQQQVD